MKLKFSPEIFEKSSNIKCNKSPSSGRRVVSCEKREGQTDGHRDMTKLIVAFRSFAKSAYQNDMEQTAWCTANSVDLSTSRPSRSLHLPIWRLSFHIFRRSVASVDTASLNNLPLTIKSFTPLSNMCPTYFLSRQLNKFLLVTQQTAARCEFPRRNIPLLVM